MKIEIVKGTGTGNTIASAYYSALINAGIGNYNLMELSNVIPPQCEIFLPYKKLAQEHEHGSKLYTVISRKDQSTSGKFAVAGLGWVRKTDGCGFFVDQAGETEEEVENYINISLEDLVIAHKEDSPEDIYGNFSSSVVSIKCDSYPVCAVVAAVFCIKGW